MAVVPAGFAGPNQPMFINPGAPVDITSGVLTVSNAVADGTYIALTGQTYPPLVHPASYTFTMLPDNSFDIARTSIRDAEYPNASVFNCIPTDAGLAPIQNFLRLNGLLEILGPVTTAYVLSSLNGVRYETGTNLQNAADPTIIVQYDGATLLLGPYTDGNGALDIQLPEDFGTDDRYDGVTVFMFANVTTNGSRQVINILSSTGATLINIVSTQREIVNVYRIVNIISAFKTPLTSTQSVVIP